MSHEQAAAVNFVERVVVIRMVGPHRIDKANIIRHLCGVRQNVGHPQAGFPVPGEFVLTAHHDTDVADVLISDFFDIARVWFPVHLVQHGLWIEQIHLTRSTIHKELDDRGCFSRVVSSFRFEVECRHVFR